MAEEKKELEIELTEENFDSEVLKSVIPVVVDFWAPWCGPCSLAAPVIKKLAEEYKGKAKICKLNVDVGQNSAGKYGVINIPTVVIFVNGEVKDKVVGVLPQFESILREKIDNFITP